MLNFLLNRQQAVTEWQKIPWNDPDFSRRMLNEHLTQNHDLASRRLVTIDAHVDWIHRKVLGGKPTTILDLGCGPGLYMHRLTQLGHTCTGIDFSPASIAYAQKEHAGTYRLGSLLTEDFGTGYDFVMLIYGELNAFSPEEVRVILDKAHQALKPGGQLLLEVSYCSTIEGHAQHPPTWYTAESGLFSDKPFLCLQESHFDLGCLVTHFYVYEDGREDVQTYTSMHQIYTDDEYRQMLGAFERVMFYPSLIGKQEANPEFFAIVATK